ncbi:MAG: hypothetical protein R6V03_04495 [Kiritimatiellia bacterium]
MKLITEKGGTVKRLTHSPGRTLPGILIAGLILSVSLAVQARGETRLGGWGHFLSYTPTFYLNNPDGKAFTIRIRVMQWGYNDWRKDSITFRLAGPDGKVVFEGEKKTHGATVSFDVDKARKGVYRLNTRDNIWVWSTLDESVAWTGVPGQHLMDVDDRVTDPETGKKRKRRYWEKRGHLVFQATVPRRWWFWVPKGTTEFTCRAMRADRCMSQREDWGYFIFTPRGQRIRALWGQPPHDTGNGYRGDMKVKVEVEPGAAGRFWSVGVRLADSHEYSNINFSLEGVPPYLARSPEEWFDPETGRSPTIDPYDETPFIQAARDEEILKEKWPHLHHFSPCPSLGDPDGQEIIGNAQFALWNPEGRELKLRVGTYLPRHGRKGPDPANVAVTGPGGKTVFEKTVELIHVHGKHGYPEEIIKTGKGVATVEISGDPERWLAFTYPATPLVLIGEDIDEDWKRFRFSVATARHWYFYVPEETTSFSVRTAAQYEEDVPYIEICSPDRVVDIIYGREAERTVEIPQGLAGKMWYLRTEVGGATRIVADEGPEYRYQGINLTVDLKGVPGYLAPTWEQWFDPRDPKTPNERGQ